MDITIFLKTTIFICLVQLTQKHLRGNSLLTFYTASMVLGYLSLYEAAIFEDFASPLYIKDATAPRRPPATSSLDRVYPSSWAAWRVEEENSYFKPCWDLSVQTKPPYYNHYHTHPPPQMKVFWKLQTGVDEFLNLIVNFRHKLRKGELLWKRLL